MLAGNTGFPGLSDAVILKAAYDGSAKCRLLEEAFHHHKGWGCTSKQPRMAWHGMALACMPPIPPPAWA